MAQVIPYDAQRWLALADEAAFAATVPNLPCNLLATHAGQLARVSVPGMAAWEIAAFNTLRWAAQGYALTDAWHRARMAPGLAVHAEIVRSILKPDTDPPAASAALEPEAPPAWTMRADTGTD